MCVAIVCVVRARTACCWRASSTSTPSPSTAKATRATRTSPSPSTGPALRRQIERRKADGFDNPRWDFCKTARKPYDIVVTARPRGARRARARHHERRRRAGLGGGHRARLPRAQQPADQKPPGAALPLRRGALRPSPATACAAGSATSTDRKSHEALHRLPPVLQHEGEEAEQHSELRWGEIAHGLRTCRSRRHRARQSLTTAGWRTRSGSRSGRDPRAATRPRRRSGSHALLFVHHLETHRINARWRLHRHAACLPGPFPQPAPSNVGIQGSQPGEASLPSGRPATVLRRGMALPRRPAGALSLDP